MGFEILSILALFGVLWMATYVMVAMMEFLTPRIKFIPAAWLTTAWGLMQIITTSTFLLDIVRFLCGV